MSDNKNDKVEDQDVNNGPEDNDKDDKGREDVQGNDNGTGGAGDDDDDDDAGEVTTKGKKVYSEEEFQRAVKRRQAALDRAKAAEEKARELEKQHATKEERQRIEAEEKAEAQAAKFKPALVRQHVAYEMSFLGLNKAQIEELVPFVDMTKIDVDLDDNSVEGVEEEVLRIKEKFPSIFANVKNDDDEDKGKQKKRVPKADGAPKPEPKKELTSKEKIVARLRGENV